MRGPSRFSLSVPYDQPQPAPTFSGDVEVLPVDNGEPLAAELAAFLAVVRAGGRPVVDAEDGRWAVVIADALLRAASERRTVELLPV